MQYFSKKVDGTIHYLIHALLQPSDAGVKAVRGMYLKISAKKAEIGQRAAEH